jgi:putative PIN family toxin of toxin-antitoxin system
MALRAVADSNVWVAAAINPKGVCGQVLIALLEGKWESIASPLLIEELIEVLRREKFRRWITLHEVEAFVAGLAAACELLPDPATDAAPVTADPDDEYLVALALASEVDFLVSGDADLTELDNPRLRILTPSQFLERVDDVA